MTEYSIRAPMTLYVPIADWDDLMVQARLQAEACIHGAEYAVKIAPTEDAKKITPGDIVGMEMNIRFTLREKDTSKGDPIA